MLQAFLHDAGSSLATPRADGTLIAKGPDRGLRSTPTVSRPAGPQALPIVQPGQLWFVELLATEPEVWPLEYQALTHANVVIYDRVLAPTVADFLPLGGYAEPAISSAEASDRGWERGLRFASDGWSVVRLADPRVTLRSGLVSERLLAIRNRLDLPVLVFANSGDGTYEKTEVELGEFGDVVNRYSLEQDLTLTIVFGAIGAGAAPRFSVASTNGLAG